MYIPILPVHHPQKPFYAFSFIICPEDIPVRNQHEKKKLPKKHHHTKQRKYQNESYPCHTEHLCERKQSKTVKTANCKTSSVSEIKKPADSSRLLIQCNGKSKNHYLFASKDSNI